VAARALDLFEINKAFAIITLADMRDLDLPAETVNVNGGTCARDHPSGAAGARILGTLLRAVGALGARWCVAILCIGGGEGTRHWPWNGWAER
jgi:acetyl-CoA C-acetyltransferase